MGARYVSPNEREFPVVDDLDDGHPFEHPPDQVAVPASRIEDGREHRDVVAAAHQRLAERGGVNLGPGLMARKKIVDGVQEAEPPGHRAWNWSHLNG